MARCRSRAPSAYASTGMGTARSISPAKCCAASDTDILHVPYKGSGAVRADLLAGRVQMMFDNVAVMLPTCSAARCAALPSPAPKRSALVPDLPTLRELNLAAAEIEDGSSSSVRPACPMPSCSA